MNALSPFQAYTHYLRDTELVPYVYEYVMDWDDAADVVREAVTEVLSHESDFDSSTGPEGLRNWLRKICRRKAKSYQPATRGARLIREKNRVKELKIGLERAVVVMG